jgi:hypothetical protein
MKKREFFFTETVKNFSIVEEVLGDADVRCYR